MIESNFKNHGQKVYILVYARMEEWNTGILENWTVGKQENWESGMLEYWKIGKLEDWESGIFSELGLGAMV